MDYLTVERMKKMILDSDGKTFFTFICKQFADLGLNVKDTGAKESVSIFISEEMKSTYPDLNTKRQLAAIQYKGGTTKIRKGIIDGVVLRFYIVPCKLIKIDSIIERALDYRSPLMSPDREQYYNYTYTEINSDTLGHIQELFETIDCQLKGLFRDSYNELGNKSIPPSIAGLPRY
jgi:hypothetical protein